MKKVRIRKNTSLVVFLIDLSWSMAVTQRLAATKRAISTILSKAYQFRDDICLIAFQKDSTRVIIPPTHSIHLAESAMQGIPVGGKTPLSAGLSLAYEILQRERTVYGKENIRFILLSDCEGNVTMSDRDPQEEAAEKARLIAAGGYRSIIINSDKMSFGQGYANHLAKQLNASCYLISELNEGHLIKAVRDELIL
ncbi:MAG: VWA domain-containing protein [Flexilinea sp.]|nr:VWA domain-containing protein [Flexilinea sp.]